eukprot:5476396-Amphidinium_carterae.1
MTTPHYLDHLLEDVEPLLLLVGVVYQTELMVPALPPLVSHLVRATAWRRECCFHCQYTG